MRNSLYFEKNTLVTMIRIYCESVHAEKEMCDECKNLMEYAIKRIDQCMFGLDKPSCKKCPVHCYNKGKREEIKTVMRFSGPVMLYKHPLLSILHLVKEKKIMQRSKKLTT